MYSSVRLGKDSSQVRLVKKHLSKVPIPGTRKVERLEENIGAVEVVLTATDLNGINKAVSKIHIQGNRYPDIAARLVGR